MDILIKSFNRPYYLDRVLFSIERFAKNYSRIIVLDDGTPQKYLDKIQQKYPSIIIKKSEFYEQKQKDALECNSIIKYQIPIDFWVNEAKNVSDYFLLIEDDIWFKKEFDLKKNIEILQQNNIYLTKLIWLGNDNLNQAKSITNLDDLEILEPKLYTSNPYLFYFIFFKFNKFKIRKTLKLLKIHTEQNRMTFYTIYAVAGMIFNKEYFSNLWQNHTNSVDENLQIFNALKFLKSNKHIKFAKTKTEVLKTGFISSANNQHKENFDGNVNMYLFNQIANEAWYKDSFLVCDDLSNDIKNESVKKMLTNTKINFDDWLRWKNSFVNQYKSIGCNLDNDE